VTSARNMVREGFGKDESLNFLRQRHLEASDSRDKIYGFLGPLYDKISVPTINYKQRVEKIYTDFACRQIEDSRLLDVT
jgi:hypothetical protein